MAADNNDLLSAMKSDFQNIQNLIDPPGFGEILTDIDNALEPSWTQLAVICACKEIAKQNDLTLKEQLHLWRPFDV